MATYTVNGIKDFVYKFVQSALLSFKTSYVDTFNNLITGTGTVGQDRGEGQTNRYVPSIWTFNCGREASDGDVINIKIPVAGCSYGAWVSLNNGTTYHPVVISGTSKFTTQYGVNTYLQLMYEASSTVSTYAVGGADAASSVTGVWRVVNYRDTNDNTVPQIHCATAAKTAAKTATCTNYYLLDKSYAMVLVVYSNSSKSALTLNVNSKGAKAIYINGVASSSSNYTLPAGSYLTYYENNIFYFRTDGKIPGSITGDAATVSGKTVASNVPANAVFTDTTYSVMGASGSSHASGLVPDPGSIAGATKFLREDGTWATPDTTYSVMGASGTNHASGLVPDPGSTAGTSKFLREDGTWATPSSGSTYSAGTNITIDNNTISAKGLPVSAGTATSLANLPITNRLIIANISSNQSTVSINNGVTALTAGCELHVIIHATANVTLTLPTSSPYINCNSDTSLDIDSGNYAEINFVSDGTNIYVRAVV